MFVFMKSYPTAYQRETYNNLISQLEAAGVKPYKALEETYDAYKCINAKNIKLAFNNNVTLRRG